MNLNLSTKTLEQVALDAEVMLATNITDMPDCSGADVNPKTEIINRFPLTDWLRTTSLANRIRSEINNDGLCLVHKDCDGKWVVEAPREMWTQIPDAQAVEECCWPPFEFSKCGGNSPLSLLCLKSCESMMDVIMNRRVNFGQDIEGIASRNEKIRQVKTRVDLLSMAFYTAYTTILGRDNVTTNILKPFHGLVKVLENPAVAVVNGTNILAAFDSVACRLAVFGYDRNFVFAIHPVLYQGLLNEIVPGQYGTLPQGWTRNGDTLTYKGIGFIQDKLVPVDLADGTGEIWVLNGDAVGLYLETDLMPTEEYRRYDGDYEKTRTDGCAEECVYYYNVGGVVGNNAHKLMRIVDVPLSGACTAAIGDLGSLIIPQTLIPTV